MIYSAVYLRWPTLHLARRDMNGRRSPGRRTRRRGIIKDYVVYSMRIERYKVDCNGDIYELDMTCSGRDSKAIFIWTIYRLIGNKKDYKGRKLNLSERVKI